MKRSTSSLFWGWLLIGVGLVLLVANLGLLGPAEAFVAPVLFAAGGIAFLSWWARDTEAWWAAFPGCTLAGLAVLTGLNAAGISGAPWEGSLFLGAVSLGFWLVFARHRTYWWTVIPGGVLLTLAAVAGLEPRLGGQSSGAVFFLGLALTFGLVYFVGSPRPRATWALLPASALLALALVVLLSAGAWANLVWPLALVGGGTVLLFRSLRGTRAPAEPAEMERKEEAYDDHVIPQPH